MATDSAIRTLFLLQPGGMDKNLIGWQGMSLACNMPARTVRRADMNVNKDKHHKAETSSRKSPALHARIDIVATIYLVMVSDDATRLCKKCRFTAHADPVTLQKSHCVNADA